MNSNINVTIDDRRGPHRVDLCIISILRGESGDSAAAAQNSVVTLKPSSPLAAGNKYRNLGF